MMILYWFLMVVFILSVGLDLGSTWKGMANGQAEANWFMGQSRIRQSFIAGASLIGVILMARWAVAQGSQAAACLLLGLVALGHLVAFGLNLRKIR